jgi:hypothetical protein
VIARCPGRRTLTTLPTRVVTVREVRRGQEGLMARAARWVHRVLTVPKGLKGLRRRIHR